MFEKNHCIKCGKETYGWYCKYHYLEKEKNYGVYDLKTNNKGFRLWGVRRIFNFYIYKLFKNG